MLPGALCRTCLTTNGTLYDLFGDAEALLDQGKYRVAEFVGLLTKSVIEEDDGLPAQICQTCYFEAQRAYIFKTKCDRSQAVLTQLKNVKIKIRKLKSDNSTDTSKKKPIILLNGFNQINSFGFQNKTIMALNSSPNKIAFLFSPSSTNVLKSNEACSTEYVQFIQDPLNLIDFDNLGGAQLNTATFMDVDSVVVKEELSDNLENFANTSANNVMTADVSNLRDTTLPAPKDAAESTTEEQNFECPVCPYVHVSSEGLEKHMMKDHMAESVCTICNKDIEGCEKEHFARHIGPQVDYDEIIEGTTLIGGDYQCSLCSQYFKHRADLEAHISKGHNSFANIFESTAEKSEQLIVDDSVNKVESFLFNEIIEETMEEDAFQAAISSDTFATKDSMQEGSSIQSSNSLLNCKLCVSTFATQDALNEHTKSVHAIQNNNGQTVHKCNSCSETFNDKSLLVEHSKTHDNDRPYKCEACVQSFRFKHNLDCHIRFKHCMECKGMKNKNCKNCYGKLSVDRRYECDVCHKQLSNKSSLCRHRRVHVLDKPFKCEYCPQSFNYKQILNLHVKEKHDKVESADEDLKCQTCSLEFGTKEELSIHVKSHEAKARKCPYCPQSFDLQSMLIYHMSDHTDGDGFRCVVCTENFNSDEEFKKHITEKHIDTTEDKTVFKCNQCHQVFDKQEYLDEHSYGHLSKKPFECEICNQTFRYIQSLTRHTKTYHAIQSTQTYRCQLCPKGFNDRAELVSHFRTHTSERTLTCDICWEQFPDKLRLGAHMVLKHDAKDAQKQHLKCEVCSKVFLNKVLYEIHLKTHNEENSTLCELCNEQFTSNQLLNEHIDKVHVDGVYQQLTQVGEQCEVSNNTTVLTSNTNVVCENNVGGNNFVFGDTFLNNEQMMDIHAPEAIMNEIFDESSIEVA